MQGGEKWGRYSIVGLPSATRIEVRAREVRVVATGAGGNECEIIERHEDVDPLDWIAERQKDYRVPDVPGLPSVTGGLVGYFGYDTVRAIEPVLGPNPHPDPLDTPDILLMVCEELAVFDTLSGTLTLLVLIDPAESGARERGLERLAALHDALRSPLPEREPTGSGLDVAEEDFESGFTEVDYKAAVRTIKDHIEAGDCMQVVLSQRLSVPFEAAPIELYRALRRLNPSPYLFFLDLGDHHVVGASPEILVRLEDGRGHGAPDRRHPPRAARTRRRTSRTRRACSPTRRSAPST